MKLKTFQLAHAPGFCLSVWGYWWPFRTEAPGQWSLVSETSVGNFLMWRTRDGGASPTLSSTRSFLLSLPLDVVSAKWTERGHYIQGINTFLCMKNANHRDKICWFHYSGRTESVSKLYFKFLFYYISHYISNQGSLIDRTQETKASLNRVKSFLYWLILKSIVGEAVIRCRAHIIAIPVTFAFKRGFPPTEERKVIPR